MAAGAGYCHGVAPRSAFAPHRHLVGIADLDAAAIGVVLDLADRYQAIAAEPVKKLATLRGKTVINLFFENSTRTRTSFEIAAKRLSADAVNISPSSSSAAKGETLLDTAKNLDAMGPDVVVVRQRSGKCLQMVSRHADPPEADDLAVIQHHRLGEHAVDIQSHDPHRPASLPSCSTETCVRLCSLAK